MNNPEQDPLWLEYLLETGNEAMIDPEVPCGCCCCEMIRSGFRRWKEDRKQNEFEARMKALGKLRDDQ